MRQTETERDTQREGDHAFYQEKTQKLAQKREDCDLKCRPYGHALTLYYDTENHSDVDNMMNAIQ